MKFINILSGSLLILFLLCSVDSVRSPSIHQIRNTAAKPSLSSTEFASAPFLSLNRKLSMFGYDMGKTSAIIRPFKAFLCLIASVYLGFVGFFIFCGLFSVGNAPDSDSSNIPPAKPLETEDSRAKPKTNPNFFKCEDVVIPQVTPKAYNPFGPEAKRMNIPSKYSSDANHPNTDHTTKKIGFKRTNTGHSHLPPPEQKSDSTHPKTESTADMTDIIPLGYPHLKTEVVHPKEVVTAKKEDVAAPLVFSDTDSESDEAELELAKKYEEIPEGDKWRKNLKSTTKEEVSKHVTALLGKSSSAIFTKTLNVLITGKYINSRKETIRMMSKVVKSVANTHLFELEKKQFDPSTNFKQSHVLVLNLDTYVAAELLKLYSPSSIIAVANLANQHVPGGGVLTDCTAQEEELCRRSSLYVPLYFAQLQGHYTPHLPIAGGLYTKGVSVFYDTFRNLMPKPISVDVITLAAVDLRRDDVTLDYIQNGTEPANKEQLEKAKKKKETFESESREKVLATLEIAKKNKVELLVLAPLGCGCFYNPPEFICGLFKEYLTGNGQYAKAFKYVIFGIIKGYENYKIFSKAFPPDPQHPQIEIANQLNRLNLDRWGALEACDDVSSCDKFFFMLEWILDLRSLGYKPLLDQVHSFGVYEADYKQYYAKVNRPADSFLNQINALQKFVNPIKL